MKKLKISKMCLTPILIKNVNYGNKSRLSSFSDTTAQFIPVPCGRCSVCLSLKQQYIVQRVQMESLSHDLYFGTLTYNNEHLPTHVIGEFTLNYVDISHWQNMIKMIRKHEDLPNFRYFLVTEYGGRRHRPHVHFILSFPKDDKQNLAERRSFEMKLHDIFLRYWRVNVGSTRCPVWEDLCTYVINSRTRNFDLHYLDPWSSKNGLEDVAFYTTKYCLKFDKWVDSLKSKLYFNLSEADYKSTWELIKPRRLFSKGFGSIRDPKVIAHINKGIDLALLEPSAMYPYFISPVNGNTFPLCPYYSKRFLSLHDQQIFNSRKPVLTYSDMMVDTTPNLSLNDMFVKEEKFRIVSDWLDHRHTYFDDDCPVDVNNFDLNTFSDGKINQTSFDNSEFADSWQDTFSPFDSDT